MKLPLQTEEVKQDEVSWILPGVLVGAVVAAGVGVVVAAAVGAVVVVGEGVVAAVGEGVLVVGAAVREFQLEPSTGHNSVAAAF